MSVQNMPVLCIPLDELCYRPKKLQ